MPLVKPSRWRPFLKEPAKKVLESVAQEQGSSGAEALPLGFSPGGGGRAVQYALKLISVRERSRPSIASFVLTPKKLHNACFPLHVFRRRFYQHLLCVKVTVESQQRAKKASRIFYYKNLFAPRQKNNQSIDKFRQ
jgi:hypothetical protein